MTGRLIERRDDGQTQEIPVGPEDFLIGRGLDCDLRLSGPGVSRHHCILRLPGAEATLVDLGSVNGTFVNGQRVRSVASLQTGDLLLVDTFQFVFVQGDDQWPEAAGDEALRTTRRPPRRPGP